MRGISLKCWVRGHEDWFRFASGRLYLECAECGRETPGWSFDRRASRAPGATAAATTGRATRPAGAAGAKPAKIAA